MSSKLKLDCLRNWNQYFNAFSPILDNEDTFHEATQKSMIYFSAKYSNGTANNDGKLRSDVQNPFERKIGTELI